VLLILTDRFDKHSDVVINKLNQDNVNYFRLNLDVDSLRYTKVLFNGNEWIITTQNAEINSRDIKCVWARRPFVELTLEEQSDQSNDFKIWRNEWNKTLLGFYLDLNDAKWLNPLRKAYKAENKYLQMKLAKDIGFRIPDTLVSNNKDSLMDFCSKHNNNVVLKLMSQEFYETKDGFKGLYVNKINYDDLKDFNDNCENPIVLQQYIDKSFEVRYTVIGKEHLVCKIDSQKSKVANIDWRRYDIANTPHFKIEPPESIRRMVNLFMKELQLEYGALDFIVSENNEWYFLEINSMGQWLWIEDLTGLDISGSIVNWIKDNM
jgi:glutathione synthase/RimK-type ligase-like ATP-grasp enzyme